MKITFKRLLGMAALYGAVRYVRANGGPKAVFDDLSAKARGLVGDAKSRIDDATQTTDSGFAATRTGRTESAAGRGSSYASYDLDADDKLRH